MAELLAIIEAIALIPTTALFLLLVLQCCILVFRRGLQFQSGGRPYLSVLMPAHNEGRHIREAIESVLNSGYRGRLELIVADDGSTDETPAIIREYSKKGLIRAIRTDHVGKSRAMNRMLGMARGELVVTVDGDTRIDKGSLGKLAAPFADSRVGAASGSMKEANHGRNPLTWFQRLEYFGFSLFSEMCRRVDGMYCTAGTLSAFRKSALRKLGGFKERILMEDKDLGLRFVEAGWKVGYVPQAVAYTQTPESVGKLVRQRLRWGRGGIQALKQHKDAYLNRKYGGVGLFSMPFMSYWYFYSFVIIIIFLQVLLGYNAYFLSKGVAFSPDVLQYFFNWFTVFGAIFLAANNITGVWPATALSVLNVAIVVMTYGLMLYSVRWMGERVGVRDIVAMCFMFPYWILIMAVNLASNVEWFRKPALNRWKK
jgi:cellulose synthase/poly-beta-1,6-N-acetylglucosamine synthase-like glycosyltransferase